MKHIVYLIAWAIVGTILSTMYIIGYKFGNYPTHELKIKNYYLERKLQQIERKNKTLTQENEDLRVLAQNSCKC